MSVLQTIEIFHRRNVDETVHLLAPFFKEIYFQPAGELHTLRNTSMQDSAISSHR